MLSFVHQPSTINVVLSSVFCLDSWFCVVPRLTGTVGQKSPLCGFPHTWVVGGTKGGTKLATLTTV